MMNKLPAVGTIIEPFQQKAMVISISSEGIFRTRIFYHNFSQKWMIETNLKNSDHGLVCFLKECPENYHDIRIISVRGKKSVRGALVVNHRRIDYVQLMREVISCNPALRPEAMEILREADIYRLADQLAEKVSPVAFASMSGMLCEALTKGKAEVLIRDLESSEYDFGSQIAWELRQKFPRI